jgi:flagellar biosynthetic protein FliR
MRVDISFLPALATAFLLTFARVGAMVMLLPGIGELSVPSRVRLAIALVLTAILLPAHQRAYAVDLKTFGPVLVLLFQELMVGAVLGLTGRLAISALQITGSVVAQQLGLGFITVIVAMNDSYKIFQPGELPLMGDAAEHVTKVVATSFRIGIQLSAPFLVFGLLFNFGLGVLSRLMPQMQVFFIGLPLSILLGLLLLLVVIGAMMGTFVGYLEGVLAELARAN